ncbi:hypothetical protein D3C78_1496210 [compost metagenome]
MPIRRGSARCSHGWEGYWQFVTGNSKADLPRSVGQMNGGKEARTAQVWSAPGAEVRQIWPVAECLSRSAWCQGDERVRVMDRYEVVIGSVRFVGPTM